MSANSACQSAAKHVCLAAFLFLIAFLNLTGCAYHSTERAREHARTLSTKLNWIEKVYRTPTFDLVTYQSRLTTQGKILTIMIEGDGRAWLRRNKPSDDPTPNDPVGLRLALELERNVVYIARPCQYVVGKERRNCEPVFWTNARFAREVVDATKTVVDQVKKEKRAKKIRLIGYSGGGTLAALIALGRSDVIQLVTFAAPLDIDAWANHHGVSPLRFSLNPATRLEDLSRLPQLHIVGNRDEVVPPNLTRAVIARMPIGHHAGILEVDGADHRCCWSASQLVEPAS